MERLCRAFAVLVALTTLAASAWLIVYVAHGQPYRPDYSVFWTAAHVVWQAPTHLYDSRFITAAQAWLVDPARGSRPYAYPPSALIAFLPFSTLPFWPSFIAWNVVSLAAFTCAARAYARGWALALALCSPAVVIAVASGQTSLLVAAAAMFGMAQLDKRPALSGLLLGLAAAVKPQALILAPILLWRRDKALLPFVGGAGLMFMLSLLFGARLWLDWIAAVPSFMGDVRSLGLMPASVTPSGIAAMLGLGMAGTAALRGIGIAAGFSLALWARRRGAEDRLVALVAGGLLCSPYAMMYDLAALMPLAAAALFCPLPLNLMRALLMPCYGAAVTGPIMALGSVHLASREGRCRDGVANI